MAFKYTITSLHFSDGTRIQLSEDDTVVLVGPNNAGKSAALREVVALLSAPTPDADIGTKVLKKIDAQVGGDPADSWQSATRRQNGGDAKPPDNVADAWRC